MTRRARAAVAVAVGVGGLAVAAGGLTGGALALDYGWAPDGAALHVAAGPVATTEVEGEAAQILFVGDTYFGETYPDGPRRRRLLERRGYDYPLQRLRRLLTSCTLVIANLETPLTRRAESPLTGRKSFVHRGDPERTAAALAAHQVHAVSLANNHAVDFAALGLEDTLAALAAHDVAAFGAGADLAAAARPYRHDFVIGSQRFRITVIGALAYDRFHWWLDFFAEDDEPGAYGLRRPTILEQIRAAKRDEPERLLVVFPHWGRNYAWRDSGQRELGHAMIDAGADLIVGHGAHLVQEIERYRGRWIIYSLGNFVFLSPGNYGPAGMHPVSALLRLTARGGEGASGVELGLYFIASDNERTGFRPRLLRGDDFTQIVARLRERGAPAGLVEDRDAFGPFLRLDSSP